MPFQNEQATTYQQFNVMKSKLLLKNLKYVRDPEKLVWSSTQQQREREKELNGIYPCNFLNGLSVIWTSKIKHCCCLFNILIRRNFNGRSNDGVWTAVMAMFLLYELVKPFDLMTKTENICGNSERLMALCHRFCPNIYRVALCSRHFSSKWQIIRELVWTKICTSVPVSISLNTVLLPSAVLN